MENYNFGDHFRREESSSSRPRRSVSQFRPSYNEALLAPTFGEDDCGPPNASIFPCTTFMTHAGIQEDFINLVTKCGLLEYMADESPQFSTHTKIFVESFKFSNRMLGPTVDFKIYDKTHSLSLEKFCGILGVKNKGSTKKIDDMPADLSSCYRELTNDDTRRIQRGKIRSLQLPTIRYFVYYLCTNVLGRGNTSNISHYQLAFLDAALNKNTKYNLGAIVARRLAAKGPIYGGTIVSRILAHFNLHSRHNDAPLAPQRLDLAALKRHNFVTSNSTLHNMHYRILFNDDTERDVPLPQLSLFNIDRKPRSHSKEEWSAELVSTDYFVLPEEEPSYNEYTTYNVGTSSSAYQNEEASSSYTGGHDGWGAWTPAPPYWP